MKRNDVCMRCEHGKGYIIGGKVLYVYKDGSVAVDTKDVSIDFPMNTIRFCPWCGKDFKIK